MGLPDAAMPARPRFVAQVEDVFALWRASLWPLLAAGLLYTLAGLLPLLTLAPLRSAIFALASDAALAATTPFGATPDPAALVDAVQAWLAAPKTWAVFALSVLLIAGAVTAILLVQHDIARGARRSPAATCAAALARTPAALAAWLAYFVVLAVLMLPVAAALAACAWFALQALSLETLLAVMAAGLVASLAVSLPMAWASVAFGFAPVVATTEGRGPLAALADSARRVRGHWLRTATLVTLPWLIYLGLAGAVSSLAMLIAAAVAYAGGGIAALFEGRWLGWAQLAGALPAAALVPLPFAGMIVAWRDRQGLSGIQRSP